VATRTGSKARASARKRKKAFVKFLSVFQEETELSATKANVDVARQIAEEAVEIIESQRYRWKPLSEEYLERKREMGYDERIYMRTGEFISKIDHGTEDGKVWAGIPPDAEHTGEMARADEPGRPPISMWLLARFLEFGTRTIPPRNLWRPLISKYLRGSARRKFAERYRKALKEAMSK
jgi:hypothetical protein